jgi:exodeoxyribonuclease VII large subunit
LQLDLDHLPPRSSGADTKTFTVSQIVQLASRLVEAHFGEIWVEGEVSNLRRPSSGHVYFTLKDARSQLAVVMFRSAVTRLKFRLEDGEKLLCRGRLAIYDAQGRFQLTADAAEPEGTGALQLAFEQLRKKLESEGLFDPARKKPLPLLPRTIAVVTSPTGAALQDIIRVLHDRCAVRVVVCPTAVQGAEAPAEIVEALARADNLGADLIILGRGGGSLEDLWAFNTETVARAIFAARTPIISAVGHEVDVTIADLVADRRAPTPTAAAEMAVPCATDLQAQLGLQRTRLHRAVQQQLRRGTLALERLLRRLGTPRVLLERARLRLDDARSRLEAAARQKIRLDAARLHQASGRLAGQEPRVRLGHDRAKLVAFKTRLVSSAVHELEGARSELDRLTAQLSALSPLGVLARGYSLVLDEQGKVVRDARSVHIGDPLLIRFSRGEVLCTVVKLRKPEP